ncbi:MAG: membrane protein insertion efficiency factor YidD [Pseudomonadota bacterium]
MIVDKTSLALISAYQRHLSPLKGFRCASGVLHGNGTCSSIVKDIIRRDGLIAGFEDIRAQFARCRAAAMAIAGQQNARGAASPRKYARRPKKKGGSGWDCVTPCWCADGTASGAGAASCGLDGLASGCSCL